MKKLTKAILTCGALASCLQLANAAPIMRLSADNGATWTIVPDNSALDFNPAPGAILYIGPIGAWDGAVAGATGSPLIGSSTQPDMDVSCQSDSSGPATLIVQMSDSGFVPANNQSFISAFGGHSDGTVTHNVYRDVGNVLFGTTANYPGDPAGVSPSPTASLLLTSGPLTGNISSSNGVVLVNGGSSSYSLTIETVVVQTGAGSTSLDGHLSSITPPPTCNCTISFDSPASITNCAGETIPDVVASENCGNGTNSVPVTFMGAVTNGVCPQIITRTNSATDDCGTVHTFVQTITVNCLPDCTITTSVTNALVGGSNYTAWVKSAGPGATYNWNILNGTITGGQGTTNITWSAGTDTNSPITIVVTITAATGCQSTCSAGVKLSPKPPQICLGSGDTATIGFWQNKNGQGLILNAANPPALANWLASNFPCMYGNLAGKPNKAVADLFLTDFGVKGQKTYAQVLAGALACYFTSSDLGGGSASAKFGFNITPGGTGSKTFNVGSLGTTIGLQNNTSYTVLEILQAANSKCPFGTSGAVFDALNTIFNGINQTGDIK